MPWLLPHDWSLCSTIGKRNVQEEGRMNERAVTKRKIDRTKVGERIDKNTVSCLRALLGAVWWRSGEPRHADIPLRSIGYLPGIIRLYTYRTKKWIDEKTMVHPTNRGNAFVMHALAVLSCYSSNQAASTTLTIARSKSGHHAHSS